MLSTINSSKNKKKNLALYRLDRFGFCLLLTIIIIALLLTGCARWPNGGGGDKKKLLIIRVDLGENGRINTDLGKYYLVFNTDSSATQPPSGYIEDWDKGYHYIKLDNMGFCFGKWGSVCQYTSVGEISEKYFSINLNLDSLGNPEKILMNVITTDNKDESYDSMTNPSELTIDTSTINFNKIVQDFTGDSEGGPDFDISKVSLSLVSQG